MSIENDPNRSKGDRERNKSTALLVVVSPDIHISNRGYTYKQLLAKITDQWSIRIDDSYADFPRYWDLIDKREGVEKPTQQDYEIQVWISDKHRGKTINEIWNSLDKDETPLTLLEALYALKQHPQLVQALAHGSLLAAATEAMNYDVPDWFPCIMRGEKGEIRVDVLTADTKEPNARPLLRKKFSSDS